MTPGLCSNCKGADNCTNNCVIHLGEAFVDFLRRVDTVETRIGEFSSRERNTKPDLVVSGHQLYTLDSKSWILTDINTTLDASNKFKSAFEMNPHQLLTKYCKQIEMDQTEINELTDTLKKINSNKLLIIPFKPHEECIIDYEVEGNIEKNKHAQIYSLKWTTNKETYKLDCMISFSINGASGQNIVKMNIQDYVQNFRLSKLELKAKGSNFESSLIKVTNHGIFKPIVVKDSSMSVAIDGTFLYSIINNEVNIIGKWDDKDKMIITNELKSKSYKKIVDNINYIGNHKKYIAPYLLYEPNIIEIKG